MLKWLSSKYFDNIFNGCQSVQMSSREKDCGEWDGETK